MWKFRSPPGNVKCQLSVCHPSHCPSLCLLICLNAHQSCMSFRSSVCTPVLSVSFLILLSFSLHSFSYFHSINLFACSSFNVKEFLNESPSSFLSHSRRVFPALSRHGLLPHSLLPVSPFSPLSFLDIHSTEVPLLYFLNLSPHFSSFSSHIWVSRWNALRTQALTFLSIHKDDGVFFIAGVFY